MKLDTSLHVTVLSHVKFSLKARFIATERGLTARRRLPRSAALGRVWQRSWRRVGRPVMPRWGTFRVGNRPGCAVSPAHPKSRLRRSRHPATQGFAKRRWRSHLLSLGALPPGWTPGLSSLRSSTFAVAKAGSRVPRPPQGSRGGGVAPTGERRLGRPLAHDAGAVHTLRVRRRRLCANPRRLPRCRLATAWGPGSGQGTGLDAPAPLIRSAPLAALATCAGRISGSRS